MIKYRGFKTIGFRIRDAGFHLHTAYGTQRCMSPARTWQIIVCSFTRIIFCREI